MRLSKNQKVVLDYCIKNKYNLQGRFYTLSYLAGHIDSLDYDVLIEVCVSLEEMRLISWGDKQQTAFRLTGNGRDYREIDHLEKREMWANRIWGFVCGVSTGVLSMLLISALIG